MLALLSCMQSANTAQYNLVDNFWYPQVIKSAEDVARREKELEEERSRQVEVERAERERRERERQQQLARKKQQLIRQEQELR